MEQTGVMDTMKLFHLVARGEKVYVRPNTLKKEDET
jgi:hypothetical protein